MAEHHNPRGRARSHSMHEETHDELVADLDALNAGSAATATDGAAPAAPAAAAAVAHDGAQRAFSAPPPLSSGAAPRRGGGDGVSMGGTPDAGPAAAAAAAGVGRGRGQISKKTLSTLTDVHAAVKSRPPELEHAGEHVLSEEEREERELAEQERRRRVAEGGAGGAREAATPGGAGGTGGVAAGTAAAPAGGATVAPGAAAAAAATAAAGAPAPAARRPGGAAHGRRGGGGAEPEYDYLIKLLLLGDSGVGKTSLMLRYAEDKFSTSLLSTAGVDYKTQFLDVDGATVKCQIWDTAGQQRFHVITQAYYRGAHGIALVYDASDAPGASESLASVRYWMESIRSHAGPGCAKMLVGNKIDVRGKKVDTATGKALADEFGMDFQETSAKDGTNVKEAFHALAREAVARLRAAGDGGSGAGAHAAGGGKASVKKLPARGGGKKDGKECSVQ